MKFQVETVGNKLQFLFSSKFTDTPKSIHGPLRMADVEGLLSTPWLPAWTPPDLFFWGYLKDVE